MAMRLCITGPIATDDVAHLLNDGGRGMPPGYVGAPLLGVLITELLKQGHQVSAVSTDSSLPLRPDGDAVASGPGFELRLCPARPRAWRFNGRWPGRAIDAFAWERHALTRAIRRSAADLVHAHWSYEFALAAQASGLPQLLTCHDSPGVVLAHSRSAYRAVRYLMARVALGRARHLTAVSDYMAGELGRYTARQIHVVPNPIAEQALTLGQARGPSHSRRLAMICNGWGLRKNPQPALLAFAHFRREHPQAELHCFGHDFEPHGPAQAWAREQQCEAGVLFHGPLAHRQLLVRLSELDALIHPALEESFGVVIAEAMALGLPVLAGRTAGAVPWVLGMQDALDSCDPGVLVDVRSPEAMAQGLRRLFDSDYPRRSSRGREAAAARFAPTAVARSYMGRYAHVLAAAGHPQGASLQPHSPPSP
jgi:L-malate glycosyltransferase